jgi:hypothetical protein
MPTRENVVRFVWLNAIVLIRFLPKLPTEAIQPSLIKRSAPPFGPNTFALSGNIVILLDEMAEFAFDDEVICGALAREISHAANRHAFGAVAPKCVHCGKCQSCVWH